MEYIVTTSNLSKSYRKCGALNGLNMHIPRGAIYGLIGKNGAGKTTLIRQICGLQTPTEGEFTIFGVKNTDPKIINSRKRMGAVVESPSVYMDLSAGDNMREQYKLLGMPSYDGISELLALVGLENTGKKRAGNFSLGMRQRLGIAIALAGNPDFLILDEPINGLDPRGIIEIRELILKLNREYQVTVMISSHILDELSKLATHYGIMDAGSMVKEISAAELDRICRKCMCVEVTDTKALVGILEEMQVEYNVISASQIEIYEKLNITDLVLKLHEKSCNVLGIQEHDESLESYFLKLISG